MKLDFRFSLLACCLIVFFLSACDEDEPSAPKCEGIYEEETVLPGSNEIRPARDYGEGTYSATPQNTATNGSETPALALDPNTGIIDISRSISGIKYYVTFTSSDNSFICEDSITISGIDYLDTKIDEPNLENTDDDINLVFPILDADPDQNAPRGEYDTTGEARNQGLVIDEQTGVINAVQTLLTLRNRQELEEGVPYEFTFEYSFGDISGAQQSIIIYWFEEEYSDEFETLFEIKSQFPRNGRIMSPPPLVGVKGALQ